MARMASVADLLQFEAWLESLNDLDRAAMERAIEHKYGPAADDSGPAETSAFARGRLVGIEEGRQQSGRAKRDG